VLALAAAVGPAAIQGRPVPRFNAVSSTSAGQSASCGVGLAADPSTLDLDLDLDPRSPLGGAEKRPSLEAFRAVAAGYPSTPKAASRHLNRSPGPAPAAARTTTRA